jgi:KRAB domain-containing zinc finger protein
LICNSEVSIEGLKLEIESDLSLKYEGKSELQCNICSTSFYTKISLSLHIARVHEKRIVKNLCKFCGISSKTRVKLMQHVKKVHDLDENQCHFSQCRMQFTNIGNLNKHIRQVHEGKKRKHKPRVSCNICGKKCENIQKHMINFHESNKSSEATENIYTEYDNEKQTLDDFENKLVGSEEIIKIEEISDPLEISVNEIKQEEAIEVVETWQDQLENNEADKDVIKGFSNVEFIPKKEKQFDCAKVVNNDKLDVHLEQVHENMNEWNCDSCKKSYPFNSTLEKHKKTCRGKKLLKVCEICDSIFENKDLYELHLLEVHEIKDKKSAPAQKEEFKKHIKSPDKEKSSYEKKTETLLLQCQHCELKTLSRSNLNQHIAGVHEGKSRRISNTCKFCGSSFKSNSLMKIHMKEEHDFHENQCSICKMIFKCSSNMRYHVRSVHEGIKRINKTRHVCDLCGHISKSLKLHKNHIKKKHENPFPFSCANCKEKFSKEEELDEHLEKYHSNGEESKNKVKNINSTVYKCKICDYKTTRIESLSKHMFSEHGEEKPVSYTDALAWNTQDPNKREENSISFNPKNDRQCKQCGVTFNNNQYMKIHVATVHEKKKPHECEICKKSFTFKSNLKVHIKEIHEGIKRTRNSDHLKYNCDICGYVSNKRIKLKMHITAVHENPNPFKCVFCKKRFPIDEGLKEHLEKFHDGKVPEICDICGKTFYDIYSLKDHVKRKHEKESTKEICDICGKQFAHKGVLNFHKFTKHGIESQEGNKICDICGSIHTSKKSLDTHVKKCHQNKQEKKKMKCGVCDFRFAYRSELTRHFLENHVNNK